MNTLPLRPLFDVPSLIVDISPGTMQCPGGHLEYGESFAETAAREVLEETGLEVGDIKFLTATNDVFGEGKHYVTIFVTCVITGVDKVARVCFWCLPFLMRFSQRERWDGGIQC